MHKGLYTYKYNLIHMMINTDYLCKVLYCTVEGLASMIQPKVLVTAIDPN